jgi:hypothetical protein
MSDIPLFDDPRLDRLCALVFELAGALHVERQQRMALQEALERQGVVTQAAVDALVDDPDFRAKVQAELDGSLARLLRVLTERGTPQGPLRAEMLHPEADEG